MLLLLQGEPPVRVQDQVLQGGLRRPVLAPSLAGGQTQVLTAQPQATHLVPQAHHLVGQGAGWRWWWSIDG